MSWISKVFRELSEHVNPDVQAATRKALRKAAVETVTPLVAIIIGAIKEQAGQETADLVQGIVTAEAGKWCS